VLNRRHAARLPFVLPVLIAFAVVLVAFAVVHDWRARRRGDTQRTSHEYWRSAADARREAGRARATRYFNRFLPPKG